MTAMLSDDIFKLTFDMIIELYKMLFPFNYFHPSLRHFMFSAHFRYRPGVKSRPVINVTVFVSYKWAKSLLFRKLLVIELAAVASY